ncbi:hypothetical protein FUAX_36710 [Fulvitalea axinellae]|uniref:Cytochrome c maturation protein CcmE n=1 Tax=Fulvitalea axinellae TaxID=1182444 RepID=A0AAU9D9J2_9BACT|nr:hypothetical protein FUAX_36710 [Fulvitalea axinellae]
MKKSHIFGIVIIAVSIVIIAVTMGDASSYVTFSKAKDIAAKSAKDVHVVGKLTKNATGQVTGIVESPDKLSFRFSMKDEDGQVREVFYNKPLPQDFYRSEQVVVIGRFPKAESKQFQANEILLKCPSKYQEEQVKV